MGWGNTTVTGHPSAEHLLEETAVMTYFFSNRGFCNSPPTQPSP